MNYMDILRVLISLYHFYFFFWEIKEDFPIPLKNVLIKKYKEAIKMKKIISFMIIFSTLFVGLPSDKSSTEVNATEKYVSIINQHEEEIIEGFKELGIDSKTQEKLLNKLKKGELLDSMKVNNLYLQINTSRVGESDTITFPDGSKAEFGTEIISYEPENGLNEPGIGLYKFKEKNPGTYVVSTYWNTILVNQTFKSDVVIKSGKDNDYIEKVYKGDATVVGGKIVSNRTIRDRRSETNKYFAKAHQTVQYQLFGETFGVNGDQTTTLLVGNNGYDARLGLKSDLK